MKDETSSRDQARAEIRNITEILSAIDAAEENGTALYLDEEKDAEQIIQTVRDEQDCNGIQTRSCWHSVGTVEPDAEFRLTLSGGGPATQITGWLADGGIASEPKLQYSDWGIPWTNYPLNQEQQDMIEMYCGFFYFDD